MCEQEQLASDLDRALSLSQLSSLAASRKLDPASKSERSKGRSADSLAKERGGVHPPAKAGKHKSAGSPPSSSEAARKVKGQKKSLFCSVRSELSSCSNSEYLDLQSTQSDVIARSTPRPTGDSLRGFGGFDVLRLA